MRVQWGGEFVQYRKYAEVSGGRRGNKGAVKREKTGHLSWACC